MVTDNLFYKEKPVGPLVVFRIAFGFAMLISTIRFLWLGWIEEQYLKPVFHFTYYGFEWVKVLSPCGMYSIYALMLISSLGIMVGWFYRISAVVYFLAFTYTELIDKTYYLNHYYFVSLIAFLLCFVPANSYFSLDIVRKPKLARDTVPAWCINIIKFQISCVYFFAGVAKINSDWLLDAMPLSIWLPAQDDMFLIGPLFRERWVAYVFSWTGMFYDLSIPFFLLWRKTRLPAYIVLLIFHFLTGYFFQIGVFPLVMSMCTLVFFDDIVSGIKYHVSCIKCKVSGIKNGQFENAILTTHNSKPIARNLLIIHHSLLITIGLSLYITIQLLLPWRYTLYPGNLFWTEEGFRFSWRVMLVEKAGNANFRIRDNTTGNEFDIINRQFLNLHQEKQMSFQPDMMLQYAHFLGDHFKKSGLKDISVFCDCYVTMNGKMSKPIVNPETDLLKESESFLTKKWITSF